MRRAGPLAVAALVGGAVLLAAGAASASPGYEPPPTSHAGRKRLREILAALQSSGAVPQGFDLFAEAVARRESNWSTRAKNTNPKEAAAAAALFRGALGRGFFADNPYVQSDPGAWTFGSGGWFGFLPTTGLAAGGTRGPWSREHPSSIFQPIDSVVMAADFAQRLANGPHMQKLPPGERNWLAVRRGWAALSLVQDSDESEPRSRAAHRRLIDDLEAVGMSADQAEDFARRPAVFDSYPGARNVLAWLRTSQGEGGRS